MISFIRIAQVNQKAELLFPFVLKNDPKVDDDNIIENIEMFVKNENL